MAQLRYAKAVACGTALTAAGLAGYYLYTRNNLKKAKMKEKVEEGDIGAGGEENVGSGTQAIEARLQQEAQQELNMANADKANAKKCDCKNGGSCTNGCTPDIEAIEKVLEKLSAEDAQDTRNENENEVNKERQIEETIANVVDDFMMECSMDTNASSGSSLNASNEHIMEDLQALDESIPNPIHEITVSTQPQPIQEAIVPTKRQSCESMRPPLDNANRKTSSITNGNVLDNQTSSRASTTNSKSGRKAKHVNNAQAVYNGKGSIASGKKGGNKKGNDLSKLQTVDWASSVLLDEKAHSSNGTSLGNNER